MTEKLPSPADDPTRGAGRCSNPTFKRTQAERVADAVEIERWHLKGKSEREIVRLLAEIRPYTLSQKQINYDLQKIRKEWMSASVAKVSEAIARELRGLQIQEDELWEAWERSKAEKIRRSAHTSKSGEVAGQTKQSLVNESQVGDPRFMALILEIRQQRRELLALDKIKPQKLELTGQNGGPIQTEDVGEFPQMEKEDLRSLITRCRTPHHN
jgi:hypothetical protein